MCGPEQHSPCSCCVGDDGRGCLLRRLRHKSTSNSAHVSHWLLRRPWSQMEGSPERLHLLLLQPLSQKEPPQHVHVQLRFRRPCSRMEEQPQLLHWFLTRFSRIIRLFGGHARRRNRASSCISFFCGRARRWRSRQGSCSHFFGGRSAFSPLLQPPLQACRKFTFSEACRE